MNEKIPSKKGLLIDRLQVSNIQMTYNPPNPEKAASIDAQIAALRAELEIEKPLLYAPDFNLEILQKAKETLQTDWDDTDSIARLRNTLLALGLDARERAVTAAAVTLITERLCRLGVKLRKNGNLVGAELLYRLLNQYCGEDHGICTARMRLAEMIRRREIPSANPAAELSQLLRFPIQEGHGEALMNLALFLAARTEKEVPQETWLEDLRSCMGMLTSDGALDASLYWEALAMLGDPEGYLAHLLLLMFGKIEESALGSSDDLIKQVAKNFPEIGRRFAIFIVADDEGNEIECEILFTFESDETGDVYLVYTDHTLDEDGSTKVYASIFDGQALLPVETEREWNMIETLMEELESEFNAED